MNKKSIDMRLDSVETKVEEHTINVKNRGIYACMTKTELEELAYGTPSDKRVDEIWERAVNEYKSKTSKKARRG